MHERWEKLDDEHNEVESLWELSWVFVPFQLVVLHWFREGLNMLLLMVLTCLVWR